MKIEVCRVSAFLSSHIRFAISFLQERQAKLFRLPTRNTQGIVPCMMSTTSQAHQSSLVSMFRLSGIGDVKFRVDSSGGVRRGGAYAIH